MAEVIEFIYADKGNSTYIATKNTIWQSGDDCQGRYVREADYAALLERHKRLVGTLQKISEWGCNGQCVELVGTQCPCCIAATALAEEVE